jgi:hypothetical protein
MGLTTCLLIYIIFAEDCLINYCEHLRTSWDSTHQHVSGASNRIVTQQTICYNGSVQSRSATNAIDRLSQLPGAPKLFKNYGLRYIIYHLWCCLHENVQ